ncbi:baseplate J/gp47 family protein [Methylosinus sp. PW1]|uniref:baseplate J/gp47 family protein n=1 Tax=Methylosinus sp. PW1 TaxID=107636 RepID=UPI0005652E09|nr:baseplate J/gp47 family protein [Methylosinus sp. PW1]
MKLNLKTFDQIVSDQAAAAQASAGKLLDFSVGSILRAFAESIAGIALWLQAQISKLLLTTRAATSTSTDLDTWMADFDLTRIPGVAATGIVTFTRFSAGASQPVVPVGTVVQTSDGSLRFTVVADTTNANWSATLGGFLFPVNVGSIDVPVAAADVGTSYNVVAGAISQVATAVSGVDQVVNVNAFANGANAESDDAFRTRFQGYILGLSRGDLYGLSAAIAAIGVSVQYAPVENYSVDGVWSPGFFYVVADDGTGAPSSEFLGRIATAVDSVRPMTVRFTVVAPTVQAAVVNLNIGVLSGYDAPTVRAAVADAVSANINALGLGKGLEFGLLYAWALAIPGVSYAHGVTLNGLDGDAASIAASPKVTIKCNRATQITVS